MTSPDLESVSMRSEQATETSERDVDLAATPRLSHDSSTTASIETITSIDNRADGGTSKPSRVNHGGSDASQEKPKSRNQKSIQPPPKRSMSITFTDNMARNGEIRQGLRPISHAIIEEEPLETSPNGFQFTYPTHVLHSRPHSPHSEASREIRTPSTRQSSMYHRVRPMGSNISFSTARRCSEFPAARGGSVAHTAASSWSYQSKIYQEVAKPPYDADNELVSVSRILLRLQKYALLLMFLALNAILIWMTFTHYSRVYVFILVILSTNTFAQVIMALTIIITVAGQRLWRCVRRKKEPEVPSPEKIVMLLPCYNESRDEIRASVDSLVKQVKIENHPRIMMIVVDGNAKAPGEKISTQDYLLDEMLAGGERTTFRNGYIARDAQPMSVTIQEGIYQGVPYVVVGKARNQGKRDSLCFVRSFMWHYQNRSEEIPTMFDPDLFDYLGSILTDNGLDRVDYLTGMDGDTVFDDDCIYELVRAIRKASPNVVGVCGAVLVKFDEVPRGIFKKLGFYFWTLLQNAEYMSTQGLRREFQSRVTGKVNCLPGCCQLIRVSEATFGDEVLRVNFGYVPKPNDMMTQQIMGVYSEDSLHASIIFSLFPKSQTAQALRARAYTTVPTSWKVYLSQRKRWALGSLCNESLMVFRRHILWIERIVSVITVATWWIGPFIYSSVIAFLISIAYNGADLLNHKVFAGLLSIILFRYVYTFMIVTWFPHTWTLRGQFILGFFMNLLISPIMNIIVTVYSLLHSDEFSWGKTRMTADDKSNHSDSRQNTPRQSSGSSAQPTGSHRSSAEKPVATDIEAQEPTSQEVEQHAIEKFSQRGSPF